MTKKFFFSLAMLLLFTGCYTLERSYSGDPVRDQLFVANYGWYLFNRIPLACGNAHPDRLTSFVFLRNDVTMSQMQKNFFRYCEDNAVAPTHLVYHNQDSILFNIPGINIPIPLPYIITYREIQLSGSLTEIPVTEAP